ncbi:GRF zinc finger domain-containing protein [Xylariaceae sp. FL0804]|nr:GRF zinc finger domain-containing protein [Xylariaceae sp. FL0804]
MEAFLRGTKRRPSVSQPSTRDDENEEGDKDEDESTDVKLARLASLLPDLGQEVLLEALLAHDGSVEAATAHLVDLPSGPKKKQRVGAAVGLQTSLRRFATKEPSQSGHSVSPKKRARLLSKKGTTLHLYDPEDIAEHTPCSIIPNFLPPDMADDLLREMLEEAKTFERATFKLFDNVVQSPHTSSFYVASEAEINTQKHEYFYNGARLTDVRQITPQLLRVRPLVQEAVNQEIQKRIATRYPDGRKLRYQSPDPWQPNAAFVNRYAGPRESVGYHTDQLTYLGPRAVIGSLSLGVAREFRVRRIVSNSRDLDAAAADATTADAGGQIAIHLPHNSLLVMHAEMQEGWKHSVAPAAAIDPHPTAGSCRINVTYRDYRAAFHPRLTPRCRCGLPAVLRAARPPYFWMCQGGSRPYAGEGEEGEGKKERNKGNCAFFLWGEFDDDGVPSGVGGRDRVPRERNGGREEKGGGGGRG